MKSEILYRSRRDAHPDAIFFYLDLRDRETFNVIAFFYAKHKNIIILYFQRFFVEQLFGTIWNNFFSETYNVILNNKTINTDFSDFSSFLDFPVICGTGIRFSSPPPLKSL